MILQALRDEVERNIETASSTKRMVDRERDMLQGELQGKVALQRFHTDIWDAIIAGGRLEDYANVAADVAAAYRMAREVNRMVDQFDRHGNSIVHSPLVSGTIDNYGRKPVIEIVREKSDETEMAFRDAREALDDLVDRTCPDCGTVFGTRQAMKSHRTQKDDAAHAT